MANHDELRQLLNAPSESLDVELKQWIDPTAPDGRAKIAKACLAMRNNDGGHLVIGFRNDGSPDTDSVPPNVREIFHADNIQAIVSKYAAIAFDVQVDFVERDGQDYPVITIPNGVLTPVAAKSGLQDPQSQQVLICDDAIYVRSVTSNNTVSSSVARRGDWERLMAICFDNREADVGRFVRRHLAGVLEPETFRALVQSRAAAEILRSASDRAIELLDDGFNRLGSWASANGVKIPPRVGFREFAVKIDGEVPSHEPTEALLHQLHVHAPQLSGWPPWMTLLGANEALRPFVVENVWECLLNELEDGDFGPSLDFWRIDPIGEFYHVRCFEDDFAESRQPRQSPAPGTQLDFAIQIRRVTEAIAVAQSMASAMDCPADSCTLEFAVRWRGLSGRHLSSWSDLRRSFYSSRQAVDDQCVSNIAIPLDTPSSGLAQYVEPVVRRLFTTFGGMEFQSSVIEGIVSDTVNRRF